MMKKLKRALTLCLSLALSLSCLPAALAAPAPDAVIHPDASCSLTLYKYDWTNARKDGVWTEDSFLSTGWKEDYVEQTLGGAVRVGDADGQTGNALGNGGNSNGYALAGVEFTAVKAAVPVTFTEAGEAGTKTGVVYGFDKVKTADLLSALGLENGAGRCREADGKLPDSCWYYTSDAVTRALKDALAANATAVKDALEAFSEGGTVLPLTDENGRTEVRDLAVGLYLLVETAVPEMVTSTTDPFFVSLPMTTVSGNDRSSAPEGGHFWNYDVTVYPKNETGIPTLEKTVREAKTSTGKNEGSGRITDGFAHTATASAGDVLEYQVISTLPTITSRATALTAYSFYDTLSQGLSYEQKPEAVKLEFFTDPDCTDSAAVWTQGDGRFNVRYTEDGRHMTVEASESGLSEICGSTENRNGPLYKGYSNYTLRMTYTAVLHTDRTVLTGDSGNDNRVVLTWKRTGSEYYDTLADDAHVYTFGMDITKLFSDSEPQAAQDAGLYEHVKFRVRNLTDGCWLQARPDPETGIYYVTGHAETEEEGSVLTPLVCNGKPGQILLRGCEDDAYAITETETADGYTLLKDDIHVTLRAQEAADRPCGIYGEDVLGVLQNDPHYSFAGGLDLKLANIPQKQLGHHCLTAAAEVDGQAVQMASDGSSGHGTVPLTVVNTRGFDLPATGDRGTWMYGVSGAAMLALSLGLILCTRKKAGEKQ